MHAIIARAWQPFLRLVLRYGKIVAITQVDGFEPEGV